VLAFIEAMWPWVEDHPDPAHWAGAFSVAAAKAAADETAGRGRG
jgi:hypothetical protein